MRFIPTPYSAGYLPSPISNWVLGIHSPLEPLFGQVPTLHSFSHSLGKKKKRKA